MDGAFILREEETHTELANTHSASASQPDMEHVRAEANRIARETIARGQAAGRRADVPAPPAPAYKPAGIRERVAALTLARRRGWG